MEFNPHNAYSRIEWLRKWMEYGLTSEQLFLYRLERLSNAFGLREDMVINYIYLPWDSPLFSSLGGELVKEMIGWAGDNIDISVNNPTDDVTPFKDMKLG